MLSPCEAREVDDVERDEAGRRRIQLHLVLPYKLEPVDEPQVRAHLERGYRIEELQRLTDREALVVLIRETA